MEKVPVKWVIDYDALGLSDVAGVPLVAYVGGIRLWADEAFWSATDERGLGEEIAWGNGGMIAAEAWLQSQHSTRILQ